METGSAMSKGDQASKEVNSNHRIPVLIVARPDRMRDSLKFLLEGKRRIKLVGQADECSLALAMLTRHQPAVMILDTNLSHDHAWLTVLKQIKPLSPQTRCLVLTSTTQNLKTAEAAGADAVLIKGFSLAELFATIERIIAGRGKYNGSGVNCSQSGSDTRRLENSAGSYPSDKDHLRG